MRIVIDTNIWVSGLLWRGQAWQLLRLAETGQVELCIAYPMLLELEEVLAYERLQARLQLLKFTPSQLASFALSLSTPFDVSREATATPIVANDPDDDIFVLCAVEAKVDYLVTNDKHLLALEIYKGIPIVTLDFFLETTIE